MRWIHQVMAGVLVIAGVLLLACATGCQAPPPPPPPLAQLPELNSVGLKTVWTRQITMLPGESVANVWRTGSSIYVATSTVRLARIDARSGVLLWDVPLGAENVAVYKPVEMRTAEGAPGKTVMVVTRGRAFMLDKLGGVIVAQAPLGVSVTTDPAVLGDTLCVGGAGAYLGLYIDRLGVQRWRVPVSDDLFVASPAVLERSVVVASKKGLLWRFNGDDGSWDWKDRKTNGAVVAPLSVDSRAVYVACLDQRVYAFRIDDGGELWETQLDGTLDKQPALGWGMILVASSGRGLYALDRQTGVQKWYVPDITSVCTVLQDKVWVGDAAGSLKALKLTTGEQLASIAIPAAGVFVRNTSDEQVLLVNRHGVVGAYTAVSAPADEP